MNFSHTTGSMMERRFAFVTLGLALAGFIFAAAPIAAQDQSWDIGKAEYSRAELEELLASYEQSAGSSAYSAAMRERARQEGALLRARLTEGDFQVGDQIALVVEGEEPLSQTFVVESGPSLVLPVIGSISLRGVLRSELEEHLREHIGQYIREPVVRARSSIRLMITGAVGSAGYYVIPTTALLSDALMTAGGPAPSALLPEMRIERADRRIWEGEALQQAIIEGRTVDQMSLRAGDHLIVPERDAGGGAMGVLRIIGTTVAPIALLITTLIRIF